MSTWVEVVESEEFKEKYKETLVKLPLNNLAFFFPGRDPKILEKLLLTQESLYSSTPIKHSELIRDIIFCFFEEDQIPELTIVDATACIGCGILAMITYVKNIKTVEINELHARIIRHNTQLLYPKYDNIDVINDNFLSVKEEVLNGSNVMIIDPPWGGMDYHKKRNIRLYLESESGHKVELKDILLSCLDKTDLVVVRIPFNYDYSRITTLDVDYKIPFKFYKQTRDGLRVMYHIFFLSNKKPSEKIKQINPTKYITYLNYRHL